MKYLIFSIIIIAFNYSRLKQFWEILSDGANVNFCILFFPNISIKLNNKLIGLDERFSGKFTSI